MRRLHVFLLFAAIAALPALGPAPNARAEEDQPRTVTLVVRPAAEPSPALRYRLLPAVWECKPGNAAVIYNKLALLLCQKRDEKTEDKLADWLEKPMAEFPVAEARKAVESYGEILAELDIAARRQQCDWQLLLAERDPISLLLPELQSIRQLARLVAVKARVQIAEGKPEEALRTLQTGYAMARHVAQGPTLINGLVGIAICGQMASRVQDLMERPEAGNLYWALTMLPQPLVDLRPAGEMEMDIVFLTFPELRGVETAHYSPEQWRNLADAAVDKIVEWGGMSGGRELPAWQARLGMIALAIKGYPQAKRSLVERGYTPQQVEAMPVAQVVLMSAVQTYEEYRDETFKWLYVPYWQAREGINEVEKRLASECREREIIPLASVLLPAVGAVNKAVARNDRTIALLRTIEALRMDAAAHGGRWPEKLAEVTAVPLPIDPVHGGPFSYRVEGRTAVLESLAPPGEPQASLGVRYEITLATPHE